MSSVALGLTLSVALLAGFAAGWLAGKTLRLAMPNVAVATLVSILGSVGGPVISYTLIGPGVGSYVVAVLVAGCAAGLTFWPMGEAQGKQQWL